MNSNFNFNFYSGFAETEDHYILGKDHFTKANLFWGASGEIEVKASLQSFFKRKDGYNIKCNHFGDQYQYCCGKDADFIIQDMKDGWRELAIIEVKFLALQRKPYGLDFVIRHVLPRGYGHNCLKVLAITYKQLLTKKALELLNLNGWVIVGIGERLTPKEFFADLNRLYSLSHKLKSALTGIVKRRDFSISNKAKLSSNSKSSNQLVSTTLTDKALHDTPAYPNDKYAIILTNLIEYCSSYSNKG